MIDKWSSISTVIKIKLTNTYAVMDKRTKNLSKPLAKRKNHPSKYNPIQTPVN